jgi:DnaJ-class molecular chaperone
MPDTNITNYSEYYEEWDNAEEEECPSCYGTGMDKDEIYDCETCFGEGFIPVIELSFSEISIPQPLTTP